MNILSLITGSPSFGALTFAVASEAELLSVADAFSALAAFGVSARTIAIIRADAIPALNLFSILIFPLLFFIQNNRKVPVNY